MPNNGNFQLSITTRALISWNRIHWTALWYYKKTTFVLPKRHEEQELPVICSQADQLKHLLRIMLPEALSVISEGVKHFC